MVSVDPAARAPSGRAATEPSAPQPAVEDWIRLAPATALPRGGAVRVEVDGEKIALCHTATGFHALDDHCPHMGGSLSEGEFSAETVTCPWHRWQYDLMSGARIDRPGRPVSTYPVTIREGWIFLSPHAITHLEEIR